MKTFKLKSIAIIFAFGLIAVFGLGQMANGQDDRGNESKQERKAEKQRQKLAKKQAKLEQQRTILDRQRQADWTRRNTQVWSG